ncbi:erythroblast NAD(P)(+)--arginine ADP-ribosyltransferase-like [Sebastes umbrosus]|uniref:erythroblast NAD(P)(+)--arginine ADP-ribosyltransferase-like n=1 Tax=Sebastes umbrosus TaxID=72105 RepID=UPI00189DF02C|nr:erythroblast NAD(P)(+)--arginine ADP-ribosyltransferase-like [Sebastes umbrosus]
MATMALWTAVLLIYGVSTGIAMDYNKPGSSNNKPGPSNNKPGPSNNAELQLDMAPNSVDDMYDGCQDKMAKAVMTHYLENEKNKNLQFKEAWAMAETQYNRKWKKKAPTVGREQTLAIYVYTFITGDMHRPLNDAVRTQGPQYKTTFGYHALHFLLTDAIQSMNARRLSQLSDGEDKCLTVYRRVNGYFPQDVVNKPVRFGSFTSTSKGQYPKANVFGTKSCFEIITCMGADVSMHSKFENEIEVLIPPYEVFKVVEVLQKSDKQPCEVVYKLKSTGQPVSNLNCALFEN